MSSSRQSTELNTVKELRSDLNVILETSLSDERAGAAKHPSRPMRRGMAPGSGISAQAVFAELRKELLSEARQLSEQRIVLSSSKRSTAAARGRSKEHGTEEDHRSHHGKMRTVPVAAAILDNYRKGRSSLEELILELYHAEVSLKAVDDLTSNLWGQPLSSELIGALCLDVTKEISTWLQRPLASRYKILFAEGTQLKWKAGHEEHSVPILVAMGVNMAGYREIIGVVEGSKTEAADFATLFHSLRERGLVGADLFVGNHLSGFGTGLLEVFPNAVSQSCTTRFRERALELTIGGQLPLVDAMLDEIYACRDAAGARSKLRRCIATLERMHQLEVANLLSEHAEATLTFFEYPEAVRLLIASNATLIKNLKEIRDRARSVGAFSNGASAVTLAAARLRHKMRATWGRYRYVTLESGSAELAGSRSLS